MRMLRRRAGPCCYYGRDKARRIGHRMKGMSREEEISHLERRITRLEQHLAEQDAEIFRQSRQLGALQKRMDKLESRIDGDGAPEARGSAAEEKPPHY